MLITFKTDLSRILRLNLNGPNQEPCGTPQLTLLHVQVTILKIKIQAIIFFYYQP